MAARKTGTATPIAARIDGKLLQIVTSSGSTDRIRRRLERMIPKATAAGVDLPPAVVAWIETHGLELPDQALEAVPEIDQADEEG